MITQTESRPELTPRQKAIYAFIKDLIINRGYGPTVREIGSHFNIKSPNGVVCHLKALEKKGFITRQPRMSRAIQLTEDVPSRLELPLAGTIAAGQPRWVDEVLESIDFSPLFRKGNTVTTVAESDTENKILEGDFVVLDETGKRIAVIRRAQAGRKGAGQ